jgi:hypothetical protein
LVISRYRSMMKCGKQGRGKLVRAIAPLPIRPRCPCSRESVRVAAELRRPYQQYRSSLRQRQEASRPIDDVRHRRPG